MPKRKSKSEIDPAIMDAGYLERNPHMRAVAEAHGFKGRKKTVKRGARKGK